MNKFKRKLYEIIFEADTKSGKLFDLVLIFLIVASVIIVLLESVPGNSTELTMMLQEAEWIITIFFTIEYLLRIWVVQKPSKYIFSFYGIIDFLAILPGYLGLIFTGTHMLIIFRSLRLLRIFRILKLTRYVQDASLLWRALKASANKIGVFLFFIVILITILGTVMYLVENPYNPGFSSIPRSIYWAIVTLTTVGYGDIAPVTIVGQFLASVIMITGYSIIAVPTGIVTSEMAGNRRKTLTNTQVCPRCLKDDHQDDAVYCSRCGERLNE
jgi:voltage-gated potassium channel